MEGLKVAKLVSGEYIIGRELNTGLLVNVFKINISFDQLTGQPTMNIIPYMFPINNNLDYFIGLDKVICMSNPGDKLQELYVKQITKFLQEQAQLENENLNSNNETQPEQENSNPENESQKEE